VTRPLHPIRKLLHLYGARLEHCIAHRDEPWVVERAKRYLAKVEHRLTDTDFGLSVNAVLIQQMQAAVSDVCRTVEERWRPASDVSREVVVLGFRREACGLIHMGEAA
jgi:hypothetical protein